MTDANTQSRMLHSAIDSLPSPDTFNMEDRPVLGALELPAHIVMQMIKGTMHSIVNLSDASRMAPADQTEYMTGAGVTDVLNTMSGGAGFAEKGAVGVFGARMPVSSFDRPILSTGPRGHLYHETNDSAAKLNLPGHEELGDAESFTAKLEDVLKHDELYEIYPELKDYHVTFKDLENSHGSFSSENNTIYLNKNDYNIDHPLNAYPEYLHNAMNTVIHETQHAVQAIDNQDIATVGFDAKYDANTRFRARGTNPITAGEDLTELHKRFQTILNEKPDLLTDEQLRLFQQINSYAYKTKTPGNYAYRHAPGEIEAWEAGNRTSMTAEQRAKYSPHFGGPGGKGDLPIDMDEQLQETMFQLAQIPSQPRVFGKRLVPPTVEQSVERPKVTTEDIPGVRGPSLLETAPPETLAAFQKYMDDIGKEKAPRSMTEDEALYNSQIQRSAAGRINPSGGELPPDAFDILKFK